MSDLTPNGGAGTPPANDNGAAPNAGAKVEFTPEQQAKIDAIKAELLKDFKKSPDYRNLSDLAKQAETLLAEKQEQEQAKLTEVEKLNQRIKTLESYETTAKEYDETFSAIIEAKRAGVPEEWQSIIPEGYSNAKLLKWFGDNEKLWTNSKSPSAAPSGGKPPIGVTDTLRQKANTMAEQLTQGQGKSEEYIKKLSDKLYESYKANTPPPEG